MSDITICRATKQDAPYIEEKLEKYLLDSTNWRWQDFFVARFGNKFNNKTVGFGRIIDHGDWFEIASLGVDYYHRGKGIGVKLLSFLVEEARRLDQNRLIYCVTHRPGFAEKVGFKEIEIGPQALEDKRRYRCRLDVSQNKIMRLRGYRMKKLDIQKFEVRFTEGGKFLEQAFGLRHKVFFKGSGRDEDRFDRFCKHLVVIDKDTRNVVGTYRLLLKSVADKTGGFYSETEFDLKNIKKNCNGELLELGRACVDENYRKYPIINLMWKTIISFIEENNVNYVFGCASVENPTPRNIGRMFRLFQDKFFLLPKFRVYPLKGKDYPYLRDVQDCSEKEVMELLPSLIKGYLKMGGRVCSEPVWNRTFDTAVFFMVLDTEKMNIFYKSRFL